MSETEIPNDVVEALDDGVPPVRAFRQAKGQTVVDLAAASAIDIARLTEIEGGAPPTSLETAYLAVALGIDHEDLVAALK